MDEFIIRMILPAIKQRKLLSLYTAQDAASDDYLINKQLMKHSGFLGTTWKLPAEFYRHFCTDAADRAQVP